MSHYINLWQEAEKYWQANNLSQSQVIKCLIEMEVIDSNTPLNSDKNIRQLIHYGRSVDIQECGNAACVGNWEEYYENGCFDVVTELLNKLDLEDYELLDEGKKGYSLNYQGKNYAIDWYFKLNYEQNVELFGACINRFLTQVNHPQRLYYHLTWKLSFTVANHTKFDQFNPILHLPLELMTWEKYGFEYLDYTSQLELINPEYSQIVEQGYYVSAINNLKVKLCNIDANSGNWITGYRHIDLSPLTITFLSQMPHIEKLINTKLNELQAMPISENEKLWQLWQYAMYLQNLFVALDRKMIWSVDTLDDLYRNLPLWDYTKQRSEFEKTIQKITQTQNLSLGNLYHEILANLFKEFY